MIGNPPFSSRSTLFQGSRFKSLVILSIVRPKCKFYAAIKIDRRRWARRAFPSFVPRVVLIEYPQSLDYNSSNNSYQQLYNITRYYIRHNDSFFFFLLLIFFNIRSIIILIIEIISQVSSARNILFFITVNLVCSCTALITNTSQYQRINSQLFPLTGVATFDLFFSHAFAKNSMWNDNQIK